MEILKGTRGDRNLLPEDKTLLPVVLGHSGALPSVGACWEWWLTMRSHGEGCKANNWKQTETIPLTPYRLNTRTNYKPSDSRHAHATSLIYHRSNPYIGSYSSQLYKWCHNCLPPQFPWLGNVRANLSKQWLDSSFVRVYTMPTVSRGKELKSILMVEEYKRVAWDLNITNSLSVGCFFSLFFFFLKISRTYRGRKGGIPANFSETISLAPTPSPPPPPSCNMWMRNISNAHALSEEQHNIRTKIYKW